jgi:hypothetical protein
MNRLATVFWLLYGTTLALICWWLMTRGGL